MSDTAIDAKERALGTGPPGIPDLDSRGLLPYQSSPTDSIYPCNRMQLRKAFGVSAHRREVLSAFDLWIREVKRVCPIPSVWISGSFVTGKKRPNDIDVAALIPAETPESELSALASRYDLLTLQGITVGNPPAAVPRLQPIAGLVDGFLLGAGVNRFLFQEGWTRVWEDGERTDQRKGMLEVKL